VRGRGGRGWIWANPDLLFNGNIDGILIPRVWLECLIERLLCVFYP